jgi:hypothetical protein
VRATLTLVVCALWGSACDPTFPACTVHCGTGAVACPDGLSCQPDGYCHADPSERCNLPTDDGGIVDDGTCLSGEVDCVGQVRRQCVGGQWVMHTICPNTTYCSDVGGSACTPRVDSWSDVPSLPIVRQGLAAATDDSGRIYAFGGYTTGMSALAKWAASYRVGDAMWTVLTPPTHTHYFSGAARAGDDFVYLIGGIDEASADVDTMERYDYTLDTWSIMAPMPTARSGLAVAAGRDSRLYAVGGSRQTGNTQRVLATLEIYDPFQRVWLPGAAMPTARTSLVLVTSIDGQLIAIGGYNDQGVSAVVEAYLPSLNKWVTRAALPEARSEALGALGADGRIYVCGGLVASSADVTDSCVAYDVGGDSWSASHHMNTPRGLGGGVAVGSKIYAIGGMGLAGQGDLAKVEAYSP